MWLVAILLESTAYTIPEILNFDQFILELAS